MFHTKGMKKFNMTKKEFQEKIIKSYSLAHHGIIFIAKAGFTATLATCTTSWNTEHKRVSITGDDASVALYETLYIKKGDLIEFRYKYDAHCRNIDNKYFRIDQSILAVKCEPYGEIHEQVRETNKMSLKEIIETESFDRICFPDEVKS